MHTGASSSLRVSLLAFDGMEALDFAGPFEVFTTAARMAQRLDIGPSPWCEVRCIALSDAPVSARAGLRVLPDAAFGAPTDWAPDLLLIPGGVVDQALASSATLQWIRERAAQADVTASVCTGAFLLAAAGVVQDGPVTTHWEDQADLQSAWPALQVANGCALG